MKRWVETVQIHCCWHNNLFFTSVSEKSDRECPLLIVGGRGRDFWSVVSSEETCHVCDSARKKNKRKYKSGYTLVSLVFGVVPSQ